jgi:hypothetical protein
MHAAIVQEQEETQAEEGEGRTAVIREAVVRVGFFLRWGIKSGVWHGCSGNCAAAKAS